MLVSLVTPTHNRPEFLPRLYSCVAAQQYAQIEHLVVDDSPEPSEFMQKLKDPRVRYTHLAQRASTGGKRDMMNDMARGEVIVHFDDDDYYAPTYVLHALQLLRSADFAKLSAWFNYSAPYKMATYWDTTEDMPQGVALSPAHAPQAVTVAGNDDGFKWGYGFTYAYRRAALGSVRFGTMDFGEDFKFFTALREAGARCVHAPDTQGLVVHMIHHNNLSRVFGQYRVPVFLLRNTFGPALEPYL